MPGFPVMRQSDAPTPKGSPGKHFSEGCVAARAVLDARGDGALAELETKLVGVRLGKPLRSGVLSHILSGHRPVSVTMAVQLEKELGVDSRAWGRPAKQSTGLRHNRRTRRRPQEGAQVS